MPEEVVSAFSRAFARQNSHFEAAIQALISLNEQISNTVLLPDGELETQQLEDGGDSVEIRQRRVVESSMALMRRLLVDAQKPFRSMVEENKELAARIDGDIQQAQEEVAVLRGELADTSRRLDQHLNAASASSSASSTSTTGVKKKQASGRSVNKMPANSRKSAPDNGGDKSETDGKVTCSGGEGEQDEPVFRPPSPIAGTSAQPDGFPQNNCQVSNTSAMRLRLENERLQSEVEQLRKLVGGGISDLEGASAVQSTLPKRSSHGSPLPAGKRGCFDRLACRVLRVATYTEVLKADRKRLKAEKYDLLNQMKELYATLDDKEKELRDFIRNYDKIREQDASMQQLSTEREERERERWSLLRHARDEAERSLSLAAQLEMKEQQLQQLQEQLQEARRQLAAQGGGGGCLSDQESLASMSISVSRVNGSSCGLTTPTCGLPGHPGLLPGHHGYNSLGLLPGDRGSCSADSGVRGSSDRESGGATSGGGNLSDSTTDGTPTMTLGGSNIDLDSISVLSSVTAPHIYQSTTPKDCSPSLSPLNANTFSKSMDNSVLSRSVEQLSNPLELEVRRGMKNTQHHPPPPPVVSQQQARSGSRGGTWGSISRVFARSRHRKVASPSSQEEQDVVPSDIERLGASEATTERIGLVMQQYSKDLERQGTYENVAEITGEDVWQYSGESDLDRDEGGIYENIADIRASSYHSDNKSTGIYDTPADVLSNEGG
ncbi:hypothetical protein L9F63_017980, partial [Diploptera punctata]